MIAVQSTTSADDLVVARWMRKVEQDNLLNQSTYSQGKRFRDAEYLASRREEYHQAEMGHVRVNWRYIRFMQFQDMDNWYARRSLVYLPDCGSARVLQEDLARWLTKMKKALPAKQLVKKLRGATNKDRFDYITLDALPNSDEKTPGRLVAMLWEVHEGVPFANLGFASFYQTLKANVSAPFTVTVEFNTLRLFTKELDPGIVSLTRQRREPHLIVQQGRNIARLTHFGVEHEQP